jgi:hypothetical protein
MGIDECKEERQEAGSFFLRLALSTLLFVSLRCWGYLLFPGAPADNFEGPPNSIMVWHGG